MRARHHALQPLLALITAALCAGCPARVPGQDDARVADAPPPDALPPDARDRDALADALDAATDARGDVADADAAEPPWDGGPVGPACARDDDCAATPGAVCRADPAGRVLDLAPRALGCGAPRPGRAEPGARCATDADCARGLCAFAGTCVRPCATHDDCAAGQFCTQVYTQTGPAAMQPLRACVARLDLPPGVTAAPRRTVPVLAGGSATVALDGVAAPVIASLTLIDGADDPRLMVERLATREAVPATLFDVFEFGDPLAPAPRNPMNPRGNPLTALVPNGPGSVVTPAGYDLELRSEDDAELAVTTLTRTAPGSVLDVNLFYVGVPGLVPTGERGPARVSAALDVLARVYRDAGITLGEVRQFRLVGALADQLGVIDDEPGPGRTRSPEEIALLQLSAGAGRPAVNFFFVRGAGMSLGRAGGIPGPLGANGLPTSGIVVAYGAIASGEMLGRVLSHELGHYLGLFHTTELTGAVIEPLPDTPECRRERDTSGDGFVDPDECAEHGASNMMFWYPTAANTSPQQREVLRRAMLLR